VNGEIVLHSPVMHGDVTVLLFPLIHAHVNLNDLGFVGVEKIMISLTRNDYEPDICFFHKEKSQTFSPDQLHFPAPDFVVEILAKSSQQMIDQDRVVKFEDYALHGVQEYWIVDPEEQKVEQYFLKDKAYELQLKAGSAMIKSLIINGFAIPVRAMFDKDLQLETLRSLLKG